MSNPSWSYSHYSMALQCLRKYKYVVIDKLVSDVPASGDLIFGSALHSAINACLTGQDGLAIFEIYWLSYENKEVEYGRFKWAELARMGAEFIRKFQKYHADKYKLEFAEQRLFADYKNVRLEGTLDYYGIYNGRRGLRDFKTSGSNYKQEKSVTSLQLNLYAFLYLANNPTARIDTLGYTVFNKGTGSIQDLTWDFDEKIMYEILDDMVSYCQDRMSPSMEEKEYPRNLNACLDYNRKCPFFDNCHKENK